MWIIFLVSSASSAGASAKSASGFSGSAFGGSGGGGAIGASIDARIREIGGKTAVFFLTSPSSDFFAGGCLSINETLATFRRAGGAGLADSGAGEADFAAGAVFAGGAAFTAAGTCARGAALCSASFFFGATFPLAAVDFGAAVLRAAGFAAVLLVVFVAI